MNHTFSQTTAIVFKTMPYLILRFLVFTACALLFILYMGAVVFVAKLLESVSTNAPGIAFFVGFILFLPLFYYAREYVLYLVKAGHVAVITELVLKGALPEGVSQLQWGREQVQARFKEASILFVMDRLVHGTIRSINSLMWAVGNFLTMIPGGATLVKLANLVLYFSLTYIDESILARNFAKKEALVWANAKTGVILYAQSWREILKTALVCGALSLILWPVLLIVLLTPAYAVGAMWPSFKIAAFVGAFVFSWLIKAIVLDPWTLTHMVGTYLKTTEGLVPNADWESKLEGVSAKFKKIKQRALSEVAGAAVV